MIQLVSSAAEKYVSLLWSRYFLVKERMKNNRKYLLKASASGCRLTRNNKSHDFIIESSLPTKKNLMWKISYFEWLILISMIKSRKRTLVFLSKRKTYAFANCIDDLNKYPMQKRRRRRRRSNLIFVVFSLLIQSDLFINWIQSKMIGGVFIYNHKGEVLISVRLKSDNRGNIEFFFYFSVSIEMILVEMLSMHSVSMSYMLDNNHVSPWWISHEQVSSIQNVRISGYVLSRNRTLTLQWSSNS